MDINYLIYILPNIDKFLTEMIYAYGTLTYTILFSIIFIETGFVIMPFLPGDSLLFTVGALASQGSLKVYLLIIILSLAAILGDSLNYFLGNKLGRKLFSREKSRLFNKENLKKTEDFYERYGAKAIFLARFIPIIRTFAPFVAGMGNMKYNKFLFYNIIGGIVWVSVFVLSGFFFGNIPTVKENFSLVIWFIIIISVIPVIIEIARNKINKKRNLASKRKVS